ncbi:ATPase, AAA-type, core [Dillenia turbinata]|uniref:ATPase, AAA-type, core n=1 Tax=Dillenia turbinata TaxID=194707 RepID=A0AAN8ZEY8_9MAGN
MSIQSLLEEDTLFFTDYFEHQLIRIQLRKNLKKRGIEGIDFGVPDWLRRLKLKKERYEISKDEVSKNVHLKDILREYKGKIYVPEQVLAQEEEFEKNLEVLPQMSFEDFHKAMKSDKIKLLTSKESGGIGYRYSGYRDTVADLKEIASWVGKLPEYPHPVASFVSSRMMVEFGMVTAAMVAAAVVVGGVLAATCFIFMTKVYVAWPFVTPFIKLFFGLSFGILERICEYVVNLFSDGGIFSKLSEFYTFGGVSASIEMLKPLMTVLLTMVLLVQFTLSRRSNNFRKWDIWQGIDFSHSKAEARVDVRSTGVKFSDVAGIEEAVEELHELDYHQLSLPDKSVSFFYADKLVRYLKNPELFDKMGIKSPHGTLVAKARAGEAGVPFYQMARSEFVEVLVGVGSAHIRIYSREPRRQGIFSESTDHLYNAATQEGETTLNQLLIELDGFDIGKGVIFLGATNHKNQASQHKRVIGYLESACSQRWTGAKLAQLLQEAALVAVRTGHDAILQVDVDDAVDRLTVGPKQNWVTQGQCRRAAIEVGTAFTSHLLRRYENAKVERCDRISINPCGQLYMFERRPQLLHRLQVFLGGRAAEEVIYGWDTSRASVDYLADASWLACKILTVWNLENPMTIHGEPPPWRKRVKFLGPRLDFEGSLYNDYDLIEPPINFKLDDQVSKRTEELLNDMYIKTVSLLQRHHAALLKTVKVLLYQKEINGEERDFILNTHPDTSKSASGETKPRETPIHKDRNQVANWNIRS